jgi:hypothetical protein
MMSVPNSYEPNEQFAARVGSAVALLVALHVVIAVAAVIWALVGMPQ